MPEEIGWKTILITALVTSFFTSCITEPVKLSIHAWLQRRELRRAIYHEIFENFAALLSQVDFGKTQAKMIPGIGERFKLSYRRLAYDMALKEPSAYYKIGHDEIYWIGLLYSDWETVINGHFESDRQRLANASVAMQAVLYNMKNRHISKRMMFRVSTKWMRCYFRAHLPNEDYSSRPGFMERHVWRRLDRAQYAIWRAAGSGSYEVDGIQRSGRGQITKS